MFLPDDPKERARIIEENSKPKNGRRCLPKEYEEKLACVDELNAKRYARMEEQTYQLEKLADELVQNGVVVAEIDTSDVEDTAPIRRPRTETAH